MSRGRPSVCRASHSVSACWKSRRRRRLSWSAFHLAINAQTGCADPDALGEGWGWRWGVLVGWRGEWNISCRSDSALRVFHWSRDTFPHDDITPLHLWFVSLSHCYSSHLHSSSTRHFHTHFTVCCATDVFLWVVQRMKIHLFSPHFRSHEVKMSERLR